MSDKKVVIAGCSGHGFVVVDAAFSAGINVTHYTDKEKAENNPYNLTYLGFESRPNFFEEITDVEFILGIGDSMIRSKVFQLLLSNNINVLNVIDSSSVVSSNVTLGRGNFVSKNATVNPMVRIGDACIVNTGAIIEHECVIGSSSHIAPGAVLAGNVRVGNGSFIGANSVIKEGVTIGDNVIVGAGSVVLKDVENNQRIAGNPARMI